MAKIFWKRNQIHELIDLVESEECLWKVGSDLYRDQNERKIALFNIALQLGVPYEEIRRKLHSLRAQHSKERIKISKSKNESSGNEVVYKSKWEFFDRLQFMFCQKIRKKTSDPLDVENYVDKNHDNATQRNKISIKMPALVTEENPPRPRQGRFHSSNVPKKRRIRNKTETEYSDAIQSCLKILSSTEEKDEYSVFGEYLATELRLLKDAPDLQCKLKNAVQSAILAVSSENTSRKYGSAFVDHSAISASAEGCISNKTAEISVESLKSEILN